MSSGFQLGDQPDDRRRAGIGIGLAIPGNAGIRIDPDQRRLAMVGNDCGFDVDNLHRCSRHLESAFAGGPGMALLLV